MCVCILWTSYPRAKIHYYYMWPFARKFYHSWMRTMTSSNEISRKLPPPEVKSWFHSWKGHNSPGAEKPNSITSAFFNAVDLLPKDLRLEHGVAKVASCPGRHLTSLRLCCTVSIPETVFWLWKLPESCVSYNFSIAFLISLLLFLSKLPASIINELVTKIYLHSSATSPELC